MKFFTCVIAESLHSNETRRYLMPACGFFVFPGCLEKILTNVPIRESLRCASHHPELDLLDALQRCMAAPIMKRNQTRDFRSGSSLRCLASSLWIAISHDVMKVKTLFQGEGSSDHQLGDNFSGAVL